MNIIDPVIAQRPTGPAYYARALAHFYQGNRVASTQDLALAIRAEPNNPIYRNLERQLNTPVAPAIVKSEIKR